MDDAEGGRRGWTIGVAAAAVAAALAVAWSLEFVSELGAAVVGARALAALALIGAGALAWARRPGEVRGPGLVLAGLLYPIGLGAVEGEVPWRYTLHLALDDAWIVVVAFLALSVPASRPAGVLPRLALGLLGAVVLGAIPFELAWSAPAADCLSCAPAGNLLFQAPPPFDLLEAQETYRGIRDACVAAGLLVLGIRWGRASPPLRRVIAPVLAGLALLAAKLAADERYIAPDDALFPADRVGSIAVPNALLVSLVALAFVGDLVRVRQGRGRLTELVNRLGRTTDSSQLRDLLAEALGDPGLRIGFWADPPGAYVDAAGRSLGSPGRQASTLVAGSDGPLAVLLHDPALLEDREYVAAVGTAARLALDNERLKAEVRAQLELVSRSRARIVEASDAARRRIERDLHDGAQQRLVSLSLSLALLRRAVAAGADPRTTAARLDEATELTHNAIEQLRDLARGIHPTILTEAGLGAALHALAEQAPVPVRIERAPPGRLPGRVEAAAYFVCSEAIANAAKHADAREVVITVADRDGALELTVADDGSGGASLDAGTGLRGLADRVEALGGRLEVDSPPGAGTRLHAVIPR